MLLRRTNKVLFIEDASNLDWIVGPFTQPLNHPAYLPIEALKNGELSVYAAAKVYQNGKRVKKQ